MSTLTKNQKVVINLLGATNLEQAKQQLNTLNIKMPNRITKEFILNVQNRLEVANNMEQHNAVMQKALEDTKAGATLSSQDFIEGLEESFGKSIRHQQINTEIAEELNGTLTQMFLQNIVADMNKAMKDYDKLTFTTKSGKRVNVGFVRFASKNMVRRSPVTKGRAYIDEMNFPVVSETQYAKRIVNLNGGEEPITVRPSDIAIEDLQVEYFYKGKMYKSHISKFDWHGKSLVDVINEQPETAGKEPVTDKVKSTQHFYHQNHGIGNLVALAYEKDGTPIFVQNDEYGNAVAMFSPAFEDEMLSTLGYEITEEEYGDSDDLGYGTQSPDGLAGAMDASQLRLVYASELLAFEERLHDDIQFIGEEYAKLMDGKREQKELFYSMGRAIADIDNRTKVPTITYTYTGLPEMVYVLKDLPARQYTVGSKTKSAPEVLVMGEESGRLYVTNPRNLYSINSEKGASYTELRYKWTNPADGSQDKHNAEQIGNMDFSNMESDNFDNDFINGYDIDTPQQEDVEVNVKSAPISNKEVAVKAEHIAKYKLPVPEMDYKVMLNYVPLADGNEIATISFEVKNVTYLVRYVYSAEKKSVVAKASFPVKTDKSQQLVNGMKDVVAKLWHKNKPEQKRKQA